MSHTGLRLPQCLRCPVSELRVQVASNPAPTLRGKCRLSQGWEEFTAGSSCGTGRRCSPGS